MFDIVTDLTYVPTTCLWRHVETYFSLTDAAQLSYFLSRHDMVAIGAEIERRQQD